MSTSVCPPPSPPRLRLPLVLSWSRSANPLPVRAVRCPERACPADAPAFGRPFDFCGHVRALCADVARRCPELSHIDVSRLLFGMTQARSSRRHGLQARVTPLRFRGGRLVRARRGVVYQVQRYLIDNRDMLYLVTFCLPRFLDQDFGDKFVTLFHELYHIGPAFDGDLRRHGGRCAVHTTSKRDYDRRMADLARAYLASKPDPALFDFLRLNFAELRERHGSVAAVAVPRPKLIPVSAAARDTSPRNGVAP